MKQFLAGCVVAATISGLIQATIAVHAQDDAAQNIVARAPFTVVGDQGQVLMDLTVTGNGPLLTIHGSNGQMARIGASSFGMAVSVGNVSTFASLQSQDTVSGVIAKFGGNAVSLTAKAQEQHLLVGDEDHPVVDLGVKPGTNAALRIAAPNGTVVANVGSNKKNGDAGAVFVGNASGTNAGYMLSDASGAGHVGVQVSGQDVVRLEPNINSSGGKVTVGDTSGTIMFNAGTNTSGEGAVCKFTSAEGMKCL